MSNTRHNYDWCYVSGRVNVLECYLSGTNFFERLLACNNLEDVLSDINNTPLKSYFSHIRHLYEFESLLEDYYYSRLYEIRSLSPDQKIGNFFLIKKDVFNLKKFIKSGVFDKSADDKVKGIVLGDNWYDVWHEKAPSLPEVFKESIAFLKTRIDGLRKESLPFIIDLIFDGAYLRFIENFCHDIKHELIKRYLKTYQLVRGIETIHRAKVLRFDMALLIQYFLRGFNKGHVFRKLITNTIWTSEDKLREILEGNLPWNWGDDMVIFHSSLSPDGRETLIQILFSELSKNISFQYGVVTDNYLLDMIRSVKYIPFGPEKVFGYLCGLTAEVFNLKIVLGGKVHGIESRFLRERLRKTYV